MIILHLLILQSLYILLPLYSSLRSTVTSSALQSQWLIFQLDDSGDCHDYWQQQQPACFFCH